MESLFTYTLFGSVLAFYAAIAVFFIILFICENQKNGWWATVSFIILMIAYYYKSTFNPLDYLDFRRIGAYLGIGLVFSFIRCYFYATREKNRVKKFSGNDEYIQKELISAKDKIKYELKGNVFRWWFMWPASLLYWILSDLIADAYNAIYKKVSGIYNAIVEYAFK